MSNQNVNVSGESDPDRDSCLNDKHNKELGWMDYLVRVNPAKWFKDWKQNRRDRNEA